MDELDALTDVEDHLQFILNIIQRVEISAALKNEIHSQINQIQKRRDDPNLYLAVIGEFSSGKSTFINADMAKYKTTVDNLMQEQKAELQHLTNLQTITQGDIQEIARRQKSLSAKLQRLAAIEGK